MRSFKKKGQAVAVGQLLGIIIAVAVGILLLIVAGVMAGKTYSITQDDIDEIGIVYYTNATGTFVNETASNYTIQNSIKNGVAASFSSLEDAGDLMPLAVLAGFIGVVFASIIGIGALAGAVGNGGRGGAL